MTRFITTWFYVGLLPKAPGTWGTAAALPFAVLLHAMGGFPALLAGAIIAFFVGWWATAVETRGKEEHDPGEIVIDEVAGMWITLMPFSFVLWRHGYDLPILPWPGLVAGFILFRLFDIFKPWPVSWADRKPNAFGVMFDDVLAGIYAGICMLAIGFLFHRYF